MCPATSQVQTDSFLIYSVSWDSYVNNIWSSLNLQPKSAEQREKVRKASTEGIAIQGQQGSRLLPEQLLSEAFILSDLFDIGELAALELLLAGKVDIIIMQNYKGSYVVNLVSVYYVFFCVIDTALT